LSTSSGSRIVWTGGSGQRPLPDTAEPDTGAFWERARAHELTYVFCPSCERVIFYPRAHCTGCGSRQLETRVSTGLGVVYSYTVIHRNPDPAFRDQIPYVVALIDLAEGFRMLTQVEGDGALSLLDRRSSCRGKALTASNFRPLRRGRRRGAWTSTVRLPKKGRQSRAMILTPDLNTKDKRRCTYD
jgi:uncharacterized OB-fold protein